MDDRADATFVPEIAFGAAQAYAEMALTPSWEYIYLQVAAFTAAHESWLALPEEALSQITHRDRAQRQALMAQVADSQREQYLTWTKAARYTFRAAVMSGELTAYGRLPADALGGEPGKFAEVRMGPPDRDDWLSTTTGAIVIGFNCDIWVFLDRDQFMDWIAAQNTGNDSKPQSKAKQKRDSDTRKKVLELLFGHYKKRGDIGHDTPAAAARNIAWAAPEVGLFPKETPREKIEDNLTVYIRRYRKGGYIKDAVIIPMTPTIESPAPVYAASGEQ